MNMHGTQMFAATPRADQLSPVDPVDLFFQSERDRPAPFAGQCNPAFQAALADYHTGLSAADCDFYHTIQTPDGTVYPGAWDLRGHEAAYLGNVPLAGTSVLECGPASGSLSAYIARSAKLTVLDIPFGGAPDMMPTPGAEVAEHRRNAILSFTRLRNSWWFTRQRLGFEANAVYGDIYAFPGDIGRFDTAVMGAILLHLSSPFKALEQAASVTDGAIVVTDVLGEPMRAERRGVVEPGPSRVVFSPSLPPIGLTHWWALNPSHIEQMLQRLGFGDVTTTTHAPAGMSPAPSMFTVVGRRVRTAVPVTVPTMPAAEAPAPAPAPVPARTAPEDATGAPGPVPVPSGPLRHLVAGTEDEQTFIGLGRLGFEALTATLRENGADPALLGRVLDFGCGVGRVARHWATLPSVAFEGTDLSELMIGWDRANFPFGRFAINGLDPVLTYEDGRFGLIYALSVFTHLPHAMQVSWLRELLRVTRPGGLLYVTTHGIRYLHLMTAPEQEVFGRGEVVVTGDEQPGSNHCAAFHPVPWFHRLAGPMGFEIVDHRPCGAKGNPEQDSWLLRRKA